MKLIYLNDLQFLGFTTNPGQVTLQYNVQVLTEGKRPDTYSYTNWFQIQADDSVDTIQNAIRDDIIAYMMDNYGETIVASEIMIQPMLRMA